MRKSIGCAIATVIGLAVAIPAGAADQTVTADVGSTLSIDTAPTATVSGWTLASSGANTTSGGTVGITSNQSYTVSVSADKAALSEYDTATSAYVVSGRTLSSALSIIATRSSGTAAVPGLGATAVTGTSTLLATGTGLGTDTYAITLSQPTLITDAPLPSGRTYRIALTYAVAPTL